MKRFIKGLLRENLENIDGQYFHGTRTPLPFQKFDKRMDGSGIVSTGRKYGGFFFTSELENAEFYTEYFIAEVRIKNINTHSFSESNPSTILKKAIEDGKNYFIPDVHDGAIYSDVVVVPNSNLDDIIITKWNFIGDKEDYFEKLDQIFGDAEDEENYITKDMINDIIDMTGDSLDYLLKIPIFREYYETK